MGREENRVIGSHMWELGGCDVTGHKSNGTDSVWDLWCTECLLGGFHQSAANIRVIKYGLCMMIRLGKC